MKSKLNIILLFILTGIISLSTFLSCQRRTQQELPPQSLQMEKGATPINPSYLFSSNCASCHSLQGQRLSGSGGALLPSRLASLGNEQIQEIIAKGRGNMPPFENKLSPSEISALVNFLKY